MTKVAFQSCSQNKCFRKVLEALEAIRGGALF